MVNDILNALSARDTLDSSDINLIQTLKTATRRLGRHQELVRAGSWPKECFLMRSGISGYEKRMRDGSRQITAIYYPGELLNLHSYVVKQVDHSVVALTPCEVVVIPHLELARLIEGSAHLARAILLQLALDSAIQRTAIATMGRVPAAARLGRFYCEAYLRLKLTGRADNLRLDLGLSQDQIADVLGLSSVHINRSLRKLREKKLISRERHVYTIHDWDRLVDECQFDATYLSLIKQPR